MEYHISSKTNILGVGILFTAFSILSNLAAVKLVTWGAFSFPAGLIFFPLTYIFDDILTEVYGFQVSRCVIWMALFANLIVTLGTTLTIYLPFSENWPHQAAYASIYNALPRVFIASILGYLFGEFINSIILAKLKVHTAGKHLWLRILSSTAVGVGIDTIIFAHVAYLFTVPYSEILHLILTFYCFKVGYEILALPLTYKITNYLKRKDKIDHYDVKTKFHIFSLSVDKE